MNRQSVPRTKKKRKNLLTFFTFAYEQKRTFKNRLLVGMVWKKQEHKVSIHDFYIFVKKKK